MKTPRVSLLTRHIALSRESGESIESRKSRDRGGEDKRENENPHKRTNERKNEQKAIQNDANGRNSTVYYYNYLLLRYVR